MFALWGNIGSSGHSHLITNDGTHVSDCIRNLSEGKKKGVWKDKDFWGFRFSLIKKIKGSTITLQHMGSLHSHLC